MPALLPIVPVIQAPVALGRSHGDVQQAAAVQAPSGIAQSFHKTAQPQFGNVFSLPIISGIVNVIGKIQQNPITELVFNDVGGMVIPRSYLEYKERGTDMGIETSIREISGTISNVFLAGWMALLSMNVVNWLDKLNSQRLRQLGVPTIDWRRNHIHAESLSLLGNQFAEVLNKSEGNTLAELKHTFYDAMLKRVQSNSASLAKDLVYGVEKSAQQHAPAQVNLGIGAETAAHQAETHALIEGVLTPEQRHRLVVALAKSERTDKAAMQQLKPMAQGAHSFLTETVSVWVDKANNKALHDKSLALLLKEMRTFWRQYINSVAVKEHAGLLKSTDRAANHPPVISSEFIQAVSQRLFGPENGMKATGLQKWFPSIKQGVLPYVLNKRRFLTAAPFVLAIGMSMAVAFINNWLTQRRHHGQVFFPGLGSAPDETQPAKRFNRTVIPISPQSRSQTAFSSVPAMGQYRPQSSGITTQGGGL